MPAWPNCKRPYQTAESLAELEPSSPREPEIAQAVGALSMRRAEPTPSKTARGRGCRRRFWSLMPGTSELGRNVISSAWSGHVLFQKHFRFRIAQRRGPSTL
jgi:hypothetical protein